jgi:tetratricopeptide (TPR) repeat protein
MGFIMRKTLRIFCSIILCLALLPSFLVAQKTSSNNDSIRFLIENYRFSDAVAFADKMIASGDHNPDLLFQKGRALSASYMYREAASTLLEAYKTDTMNILVIEELINAYSNSGEDEAAILYAVKPMKLQPANPFFRLQLANLYFGAKENRKAVNTLAPLLLTKDSVNASMLKQLGTAYAELGANDTAAFYFEKALSFSPNDFRACQKLINVFLKLKDYDSGLLTAEKYLISDSLNTNILRLKAYCNYLKKDFMASESGFRKCIILGDESKFVLKYIGMSLYMQEDYFESCRYFKKTFALDSTDAEIAYYIGVTSYKSDNTEIGISYLQKAMELDKSSSDFLSTICSEMAGAYNQLGKTDTATNLLLRANAISPTKKTTLFRIAYQYDKYLTDKQKALIFYKAYLDSDPENGDSPISASNKMSFRQFAENRIAELKKSP